MKPSSIFIIIAAGCILMLPIIFYGIPFESDDAVTHARWYLHFSEQFWAGDLYPRWLMGMNNGLGSPVFFYYPPVSYFLTCLLKPLLPVNTYVWHQLGISAVLALIASGFCAYLWLKQVVNETSALIAAVLYMLTPYHLASDLYIRCSFAEFWAFVWLPLILYLTHKILNGYRLAVIGLAVSYALLIMTHLPTTLIFSPALVCYAAVLKTDQRLKNLGTVIISMALGVGLSAIFLYPAMTMQQYVFLDRMDTGYFSYENWLFFANFSLWTDDKLIILLLILDLTGIAVCCRFIISRFNLDENIRKLSMFWLALVTVSVLMMTELSKPVWLIFYPLQRIQFPFRFNVILTLAVTALIAMAFSALNKPYFSQLFGIKLTAFLLIAGWVPASVWTVSVMFPLQNTNTENQIIQVEESREAPEYRPKWSASMNAINWETSKDIDHWDTQTENEYNALMQRTGVSNNGISKVRVVQGVGQIDIISREPREIRLHAKAMTGMKIFVSQFYYPNWTARLVEEQTDLNVEPSPPDGLLELSIPEGDHEILLRLNQGKEEITGKVISLISVLCLLFYIAWIGFVKKPDKISHN